MRCFGRRLLIAVGHGQRPAKESGIKHFVEFAPCVLIAAAERYAKGTQVAVHRRGGTVSGGYFTRGSDWSGVWGTPRVPPGPTTVACFFGNSRRTESITPRATSEPTAIRMPDSSCTLSSGISVGLSFIIVQAVCATVVMSSTLRPASRFGLS